MGAAQDSFTYSLQENVSVTTLQKQIGYDPLS